jgi:pimeloyl-ACP methyl ester carboxylesterase
MARFVLIHGAWHGGWCWQRVVDILIQRGHAVIAPDLPGHGDDTTIGIERPSLQEWIDRGW